MNKYTSTDGATTTPQVQSGLMIGIGISAMFALWNFGQGFFHAYFPLHLEALSFTPVQIAFIVALPNLLRIIASPVLTGLADRAGRRRHSIALCCIGYAAAFVGIIMADVYLMAVALMVLVSLFNAPVQPLMDAYAYEAVRTRNLSYGPMRAVGSAFYVLSTLVGGFLVALYAPTDLMWLLVLGTLLTGLIAPVLPGMPSEKPQHGKRESLWKAQELRRVELHLALLATGLVLGAFGAFFSFASIFWLNAGIEPSMVGVLWAAGTMAEIGVFVFGAWFLRTLGARNMMLIGAAAGVLRWFLFPYATDLWMALGLQTLHALNYGMLYLGLMSYVASVVSSERLGTAQGMTQTYFGVCVAGAGIASGVLFELSPVWTFWAMGILCAIGLTILLVMGRNWGNARV
ncbi:MFS transporter [Pseudovibrio exalbescens]|uniref:MFS transporter n=1 Tax=Pseudovibrio exalbescens TaxID=197461 RepID=UPI0023658684|nr:MFS transporter [Pseudovibrio exalbescens]MDD7910842.1 MFS transporter [Pseudovibrio exalbescens]